MIFIIFKRERSIDIHIHHTQALHIIIIIIIIIASQYITKQAAPNDKWVNPGIPPPLHQGQEFNPTDTSLDQL
jgi:hypothetical protein